MTKPYVIGIAGGSASGKSTLCDGLESRMQPLSIKVFHMDDYFRPVHERPRARGPLSGVEYMDDNHPETMDLDRLHHDLLTAVDANEVSIILVEGLLTLCHEGILSLLDLKIFVDCPADERIVRRLRRNMEWGLTFDQISTVYLDLVRFRHNEYVEPTKWQADIILNGSHPSERAMDMIVKTVIAACDHTKEYLK